MESKTNSQEFQTSFIELLKNPKLKKIFIAGAGVSSDSNIPTVNTFFRYLFKEMGLEPEAISWICKTVPFEFVIQILSKHFGGDANKLCRVFEGNVPNDIHHFILHVLKNCPNTSMISSNFDTLFEKKAEVLGYGMNFHSLPSEGKQYQKGDILKYHGTIDDIDNIVNDIRKTHALKGFKERLKVLGEVFESEAGKDEKTVAIFIGKGTTDEDLEKFFRVNKNRFRDKLEILFIQFDPDKGMSDLQVEDFEIYDYPGKRVLVKTREICRSLLNGMGVILGEDLDREALDKQEKEWQNHVSDIVRSQKAIQNHTVVFEILSYIYNARVGALAGYNIDQLFQIKSQMCRNCKWNQNSKEFLSGSISIEEYKIAVDLFALKLGGVIDDFRNKMISCTNEENIHEILFTTSRSLVSEFVQLKYLSREEFETKFDKISENIRLMQSVLTPLESGHESGFLNDMVEFHQNNAQFHFISQHVKNISLPDFSSHLSELKKLRGYISGTRFSDKNQKKIQLKKIDMLQGLYLLDTSVLGKSLKFFQQVGDKESEVLCHCFLSMVYRKQALESEHGKDSFLIQAKKSIVSAHEESDISLTEVDISFPINGNCPLEFGHGYLDIVAYPDCLNKSTLLDLEEYKDWDHYRTYLYFRTH